MSGGADNDRYVVDDIGDQVIEAAGEGYDTVYTGMSYTLGANVEALTLYWGAGSIDGTGNGLDNLIYGNDSGNRLEGRDGNDTLDGAEGSDVMLGGLGDDVYMVDRGGDVVTELAGQGHDTVIASVDYVLGANVEDVILNHPTAALDADGNGLDNRLWGNSAGNWLTAEGGNDELRGLSGNDVLRGGSGDDDLFGGAGADTLTGGIGADRFVLALAADSGVNAYDTIADFSRLQGDRIDLAGIDASTLAAGDQAFSFIGASAFTGVAGQLRFAGGFVQGDVDGNGAADFRIAVNAFSLMAGDFVL
jgi:Ca2+-binding RTX toxin-like protein